MKRKRHYLLLAFLINQAGFISAKKTAEHLGVSDRTIYNDINSKEFKELLSGAVVERKQSVGLKLNATKTQKKEIYRTLNRETVSPVRWKNAYDDVTLLLLQLFTSEGALHASHLSEAIYKSKSGIGKELGLVENWLANFGVTLESKKSGGYFLGGEEINIQMAFKELCFSINLPKKLGESKQGAGYHEILSDVFSAEIVEAVFLVVKNSEINLDTSYTDYDHASLTTKLCILVFRNKLGKIVHSNRRFGNDVQEYMVAQLVKMQLENALHIALSQDELNEMTSFIFSTRRQDYRLSVIDEVIENNILDQLLDMLSISLGADFKKDEELKRNLLFHLKPAIRRIRYGITIENPLLTQIKREYTDVYIAVMTSIEKIEKQEHISFDENELGYICLHIMAAIHRVNQSRHLSVCLICDGGLTISTFLKSKIENRFSELGVKEQLPTVGIEQADLEKIDLFLNTTKREFPNKSNVISISSLLDESDQDVIRSWITQHEFQRIVKQNEGAKNKIIFFKDDLKTKEEVIYKYSQLMVVDKYVQAKFYESVLQREETMSTCMGRGIAVPHGSSAFVEKSVIFAIRLEKPIPWDEELVDLVFLIAINFNEKQDYHSFFEKLFKIVSQEDLLYRIKRASSTEEFEELLQ